MKTIELTNDSNVLLEAPIPAATKSYTPISNREILMTIGEEVYKNNLSLQETSFKGNNKHFIGQYDLIPKGSELGSMGMRLLFRNSYDKSMTFGVAAGSVVWSCSNGLIGGELQLKRKHTGDARNIALAKIKESIKELSNVFERMVYAKEKLMGIYPNDNHISKLVGDMFLKEEILTSLQLNVLKEQLHKSENFYHIDDGEFTMWDFYNHCTESLKRSHPMKFMENHISFHSYMKEAAQKLYTIEI